MPDILRNILKSADKANITGTVEAKLSGNRYKIRLSKQSTTIARSLIPGLQINERVVIADTEAGRMITGSDSVRSAQAKIIWIRG